MAADRFYFWRGYHKALAMLETDEQRGQLIMAMCEYAFDGIEPDMTDPMQRIVWAVIEDQIRESVEIGRKQSERGKRGGRPSKSGKKSGVKSTAKSTALSGVKSGVKSTVKSGVESGAESVRYGNVPVATGAPTESRPSNEKPQYINAATGEPYVPPEYDIDLSDIPLPTEDVGE